MVKLTKTSITDLKITCIPYKRLILIDNCPQNRMKKKKKTQQQQNTLYKLTPSACSSQMISQATPFMLTIGPKWPNTTIFGNFWQKNIISEINSKIPLFLELEFLISFATVALLSWICAIKKNFVVLELGKLEYHLHSTQVYQAQVPF